MPKECYKKGPADPNSNNKKAFVVNTAVIKVEYL